MDKSFSERFSGFFLTKVKVLLSVISVLLFLCTSCHSLSKKQSTIELCIQEGANKKLALVEVSAQKGELFIDSISLDAHGNGKFTIPTDTLSIYALKANFPSENVFFFLPSSNEHLKINTHYSRLVEDALLENIGGSKDNNSPTVILLDFQKSIRYSKHISDSISYTWMNIPSKMQSDSLYKQIQNSLQTLYKQLKIQATSLASNYCNSLIPIFVIYQSLGYKPLFDMEQKKDIDSLSSWAKRMSIALPQNPHVLRLTSNINRIKNIKKMEELEARAKSASSYSYQ